jgi:hypothetical protein
VVKKKPLLHPHQRQLLHLHLLLMHQPHQPHPLLMLSLLTLLLLPLLHLQKLLRSNSG